MYTDVILRWIRVGAQSKAWDWARTLYVFYVRSTGRVLYVGKADRQTLADRVLCPSKEGVWARIYRGPEIDPKDVGIIAAEVGTEYRWTNELQADVESLLIKRLQPRGNKQGRSSRIERPGLRVVCIGSWPERRACFQDAA